MCLIVVSDKQYVAQQVHTAGVFRVTIELQNRRQSRSQREGVESFVDQVTDGIRIGSSLPHSDLDRCDLNHVVLNVPG